MCTPFVALQTMSVPQTPAIETEAPSEVDMSEMQVIGHDDNVRTQSLEEPTKPPTAPPKVSSYCNPQTCFKLCMCN